MTTIFTPKELFKHLEQELDPIEIIMKTIIHHLKNDPNFGVCFQKSGSFFFDGAEIKHAMPDGDRSCDTNTAYNFLQLDYEQVECLLNSWAESETTCRFIRETFQEKGWRVELKSEGHVSWTTTVHVSWGE